MKNGWAQWTLVALALGSVVAGGVRGAHNILSRLDALEDRVEKRGWSRAQQVLWQRSLERAVKQIHEVPDIPPLKVEFEAE